MLCVLTTDPATVGIQQKQLRHFKCTSDSSSRKKVSGSFLKWTFLHVQLTHFYIQGSTDLIFIYCFSSVCLRHYKCFQQCRVLLNILVHFIWLTQSKTYIMWTWSTWTAHTSTKAPKFKICPTLPIFTPIFTECV